MSRTTRFTPERTEGTLPERTPEPYADLNYNECAVTTAAGVVVEEHYRTTLDQSEVPLTVFALGLTPTDIATDHEFAELDRFGYARCRNCRGHFWSAQWVAKGLYGDDTESWAMTQFMRHMARNKQRLSLVSVITGGVHETEGALLAGAMRELADDLPE